MNILHIFDHSLPLHSGYTFRSRALLTQQHNMGYQTCHVTSPKHPHSENAIEQADGLSFYRTQPYRSWFWRLPVLKELAVVLALKQRILEVIRLEQPAVLHAHSPALNGLAALWAAKQVKLPVVYEIRAFWEDAAVDHGSCKEGDLRYRLTRALESYVAKRVDAITTICQGLKQDLIERGIDSNKITVIANAVDPGQFSRLSEKNLQLQQQLKLKNKRVLGFLGSFYAYEGLDLLLKALVQIRQTLPDTCLLLVGGGPQQQALEQLVQQLKLEDAVIMPGRVPHQEVMKYYSLVDLLVYPRKAMRLTELVTPLKPLEAMAQGMPLLASDVGGHLELIEHGKTGWLFQRDNVDDLAEQAIRILKNIGDHQQIIENGIAFVSNERNWAATTRPYQQVYARLLNDS